MNSNTFCRIAIASTALCLTLIVGKTPVALQLNVADVASAAAKAAPKLAELAQGKGVRFHHTPAGTINGINVTEENGALFLVPDGDVLAAFKQWIVSHTALLKLAPIEDESVLSELQPSRRALVEMESLKVYSFEQTYRGHPVVGTEATISLTVTEDGRVISMTGTVLDPRVNYRGLSTEADDARASQRALASYRARQTGKGHAATIGETTLVAVPARQSMAYRSKVVVDEQDRAVVLTSAANGAVLAVQELQHQAPDDRIPVLAVAYLTAADTQTNAKLLYPNLPGSVISGTCLAPLQGGCRLRMGNDRLGIYDFRRNNNALPTVWQTFQFQPGTGAPWAYFSSSNSASGNNGDQFRSQDALHKINAALNVIDPLKSTQGWDHHPNAPFGVFTKAPLSVFTNVDGTPEDGENDPIEGALGACGPYTFTNAWAGVAHPYVSNAYQTAAVLLNSHQEYVMFHELGHYYDLHTNYGMLGTGLVTTNCVQDTTDEAEALAETVADMTKLYLYKKLYPGLDYNLAATTTPCSFQALGAGTATVHSQACTPSTQYLAEFDDGRPTAHANQPCNKSQGYNIGAVIQAFWEYLNAQSCDTASPFACDDPDRHYTPDRGMRAMLYAESLSNLQSYEQFFENMGDYLLATHGQAHYDRFHSIMQHHGILP
jgi:Fungalysin/Thermolysin Propeptide Motif